MSIINTAFKPIYGKQCWNVKNGIGSFLTFEFGDPHFKVIREPYHTKNPKLKRNAARRIVRIYGDWSLWIQYCDWDFFRDDLLIGHSESSKKELRQIAWDLEGQAICKVTVKSTGASVFEFDLGGRLETHPYSKDTEDPELYEQWILFEPSGITYTFREDGTFLREDAG
jgi:hypothetical protein